MMKTIHRHDVEKDQLEDHKKEDTLKAEANLEELVQVFENLNALLHDLEHSEQPPF